MAVNTEPEDAKPPSVLLPKASVIDISHEISGVERLGYCSELIKTVVLRIFKPGERQHWHVVMYTLKFDK